jgi:hypothetical protein
MFAPQSVASVHALLQLGIDVNVIFESACPTSSSGKGAMPPWLMLAACSSRRWAL